MKKYINVTPESGKAFYQAFHNKGNVVMMNLLKFKSIADYTNFEDLKPKEEITGKEAYQIYMKHTYPILKKAEGKVVFYGNSNSFLIGPDFEKWDAILLIEHQSVTKFMEFAENKDYLKTAGHRTAALEDSRLMPITENKM